MGNDKKFFFCYDAELSRYLKSKGFEYVTRAKHYKTNSEFTLYEYSLQIDEYIKEWRRKNSK